jgi:hypothetical protein
MSARRVEAYSSGGKIMSENLLWILVVLNGVVSITLFGLYVRAARILAEVCNWIAAEEERRSKR